MCVNPEDVQVREARYGKADSAQSHIHVQSIRAGSGEGAPRVRGVVWGTGKILAKG